MTLVSIILATPQMKSLFSILDCVNFENQRFRKMSEKKKLSELVNAQIQKIEF